MNGLKGFTPKAKEAVTNAIAKACALGHNHIGSEHLLIGLLSVTQGAAFVALTIRGISAGNITDLLISTAGQGQQTILKSEDLTPICHRILENAAINARESGVTMVGTEHILIALLREKESCAVDFLKQSKCDTNALLKSLVESASRQSSFMYEKSTKPVQNKNIKTQTLDRFSKDLTVLAQTGKLDPVIGREKEISRVVEVLSRRQKNNPCL
ncbi:MAG: Clp protease N-terminal domain-containing protein, partial [Oscillospiraceae bacterium]